jgi:hypothetical protein
MAFVVNDRVQEFTTTTGTGTLTLTGSPDGFETFSSAVGNGNTTYYAISSNTTEFEVGIGTVGAGTLSRDTVISSSNSDALVNFSAGTKNVFVTLPASKAILLNDSNIVNVPGAATFAAGTVSLPSISTTGDTNTGIFFPAADTIAFSEGGTEAMRITSAGNVGIGTSSPTVNLHISAIEPRILLQSTADSPTYAPVIATNGTAKLYGHQGRVSSTGAFASNHFLTEWDDANGYALSHRFHIATSEKMRIDSSGNVGIGTTAPDAKLSVNGVASFGDGTALLPSIANFGDLNTGMWFPADDTIAFSEGGVEAMRINSSGQVGIGTTTPTSKLHILGSLTTGGIFIEDSNTAASAPALTITGKRSDGNGSQCFSGKVLLSRNQTNSATSSAGDVLGTIMFGGNHTDGSISNILYSSSISGISEGVFNSDSDMPSGIIFLTGSTGHNGDTANTAAGAERMRITSTGNVGIGTTAPLSKFRVNQSSTTAYGLICQTPTVGLTTSDYVNMAYFANQRSTNNDGLRIINVRDTTGASIGNWETESYRIRRSVDQNGITGGVQSEISFATNLLEFITNTAVRMRITSTGTEFLAGTAAAPSITTITDTNTGIFFPSADTIAFTEGGTEAMRITSDGRLGIGTTTPLYPLSVVSDALIAASIICTGATPNLGLDISKDYKIVVI